MARIQIKDLPRDQKISPQEMKRVLGGLRLSPMSGSGAQELDARLLAGPRPPSPLIGISAVSAGQ